MRIAFSVTALRFGNLSKYTYENHRICQNQHNLKTSHAASFPPTTSKQEPWGFTILCILRKPQPLEKSIDKINLSSNMWSKVGKI